MFSSYYFDFSALTVQGERTTNQDACLATRIGKHLYFLAVADGMGGHSGGEIASTSIIETAEDFFENRGEEEIIADLKANLRELYATVIDKVQELKEDDQSPGDMGSTFVCALVHENRYAAANVGDSRLYVGRKDDLRQVTRDHSYVQEFLEEHPNEEIDPKILAQYAHIITKAIDGSEVEPDLYPVDKEYDILNKDDLLLLCSDGLIPDKLNGVEKDFEKVLSSRGRLEKKVKKLVDFALEAGSQDNVTAVLAHYNGGDRQERKQRLIGF